jgi:hypothetical protein
MKNEFNVGEVYLCKKTSPYGYQDEIFIILKIIPTSYVDVEGDKDIFTYHIRLREGSPPTARFYFYNCHLIDLYYEKIG